MNSTLKHVTIDCDCGLFEHSLRIGYFTDEATDPQRNLYIDTCVDQDWPLFKRIKEAFRYIFRSKPYTFNETVVGCDQYEKLLEAVSFLDPKNTVENGE